MEVEEGGGLGAPGGLLVEMGSIVGSLATSARV
jgi:hypothetical protein